MSERAKPSSRYMHHFQNALKELHVLVRWLNPSIQTEERWIDSSSVRCSRTLSDVLVALSDFIETDCGNLLLVLDSSLEVVDNF